MQHERKSSVRQAITRNPSASWPQPVASRKELEREPKNASGVGAGQDTASGGNPSAPLAPAQRPRLFNFDAQGLRVVGPAEAPWFVAKDVCAALGIANSRDSLESLDNDEKGVAITDTLGGPQELATVNESGLYALIFRSRKPEARLFRKWVTSEVLPAIRKTGQYQAPRAPAPALPEPAGRSSCSYFLRHDSYRVNDLAAEDFAHLLYELLYEVGEGTTRRSVPLREMAAACVKYHRLWWICASADRVGDRVALAIYLRKLDGVTTIRTTTGPHYALRAFGRQRHKKYLVLSSLDPLWARHAEA